MSIRSTSREAYRDLEGRGVLKGHRLEVYEAFERFGPGTAAEVLTRAALHGNLNLARARVTELGDAGLLVESDARKCSKTGRRAIVWRALADDEPPIARVKPIRVELTSDDVDAIAKFMSGERGQFCRNVNRVHHKILNAAPREAVTP